MTDLGSHLPSRAPQSIPPGSPTYSYVSTAVPSNYNIPSSPQPSNSDNHYPSHNMADLEASQHAYNVLLQSAKSYRLSLASMSISAGNFGSALEACARLKEARNENIECFAQDSHMSNLFQTQTVFTGQIRKCTADSLLAASGLHQLIANHHQILSETIYRNFEVPLMHELDQWQRKVEEEDTSYQRQAKVMTKEIRAIEKDGLRQNKIHNRELSHFREHLVRLTRKIDALAGLSSGHGRKVAKNCQEMSRAIEESCAGFVRAEVEIFEALARKGMNGGGLDGLMQKGHDLFATEDGPEVGQDKISSTLPQHLTCFHNKEFRPTIVKQKFQHTSSSDNLLLDTMGCSHSLTDGSRIVQDADAVSIISESENATNVRSPRKSKSHPPILVDRVKVKDPLEDWDQQAILPPQNVDQRSENLNEAKSPCLSNYFEASHVYLIKDRVETEDENSTTSAWREVGQNGHDLDITGVLEKKCAVDLSE